MDGWLFRGNAAAARKEAPSIKRLCDRRDNANDRAGKQAQAPHNVDVPQ
jgi:hypothetical protein